MAAWIPDSPQVPSTHDQFSKSAKQPCLFSLKTFFHAFRAPVAQPATIKPRTVRLEFAIMPHPDFIVFQPLLHGIQIKIPLGQKSFRRATSKEPIIYIPRLNFQLFGDFIPSHISIQSLPETKEFGNSP
jgi:hypothetical protein